MKKLYPLLLSCIFLCLVGCKSAKISTMQVTNASYMTYQSAMGKGRGIIFRFNIPVSDPTAYEVDSFYVHNIPVSFITRKDPSLIRVEGNYLKVIEPPVPGEAPRNDLADPIVNENNFYPSRVILRQGNKTISLSITNYYNEVPSQ